MMHFVHPFEPIFRADSQVLILGSFPSVKSREQNFYYGHPRNRFWRVLAAIWQEELPRTIDEKRELLLRHRLALGDVVESCDLEGSSDSKIRNVRPTDLKRILAEAQITAIYANGRKAQELYERYQRANTGLDIVGLPSTSPANAAWSLKRLIEAWQVMTKLEQKGQL